MFSIWTGLNNFFHDTPSHPQQKYSKMHPTTSVWINSKQTCVFAFLCLCMCVWVQPFSKAQQPPLGSIPPRHIFANKDAQILGFFQGRLAGIKNLRSAPSVPKANNRKMLKVNLEIPEPRGKKSLKFLEITLIPYPHPPEKVELGVDNGSPSNGQQLCRVNLLIQETRMDPPNLGRLVSLLVVGLNKPIF